MTAATLPHKNHSKFYLYILKLVWASSLTLGAMAFAETDEHKAEASCSVCHGALWQGNPLLGSPNIQMLPDWYIEQQITAYQQGWRRRAEAPEISDDMAAIAKSLTGKSLADALVEKSKLKVSVRSSRAIKRSPEIEQIGGKLYQACTACHGRAGEGVAAMAAPPLAGQNSDYLRAQLTAFGEGSRGGEKVDIPGQLMKASLTWPMAAEDLDALLDYISTLQVMHDH